MSARILLTIALILTSSSSAIGVAWDSTMIVIESTLLGAGFRHVDDDSLPDLKPAESDQALYKLQSAGSSLTIIGDNHRQLAGKYGVCLYEGSSNGEWGGELIVTLDNGKIDTLLRNNILTIFPTREFLYVFTGLSHMNMSDGAMYRIEDYEDAPRIELITLFSEAPRFIVADSVVATPDHTTEYLYRFTVVCNDVAVHVYPSKYSPYTDNVPAHSNWINNIYQTGAYLNRRLILPVGNIGLGVFEFPHNYNSGLRYYIKD